MAAYSEYKESGVSWIGKIPSHWEIASLRHVLESFSDKGHEALPMLSVTRERGVIIRGSKGEDDNNNVIPEDLSGYKRIEPGDFVINKMKSWQGSYGLSEYEGIVSPAYYTYHLKFGNKKFFSIALRSKAYIPFFMQYSKGIRVDQWDLKQNAIKSIPFIIPPKEEQEAIVAYLDKATAEIDKAIEAKERIISALEERRKIIITEAVTRGINPDVPLRDSGIDWLGQIPTHWNILPLKRVSTLILGKMLDNSGGESSSQVYPYICAKDVHFDGVDLSDLKEMYFSDSEIKRYCVHNGDLLVVEGGAGAGGCAVAKNVKGNVGIQNSIIIVRANRSSDNEYLSYFLQSLVRRGYIEYSCNKATIPHFTKDKIGVVPIGIPPIQEQKEIVAYIKAMEIPIDNSIAQQKQLIELLRERKNIIINETVTGKVKVI